jgi:FkbM family methyltransferase
VTPNLTLAGIKLIVSQTWTELRRYGPASAFFFLAANMLRKSGNTRQTIHRLSLRGLEHPLHLREGRSDPYFFGQIFLDQEFGPIRELDVANVVDLGANAGFASVWFLNTFPHAKVVSIEANPLNHPSLEANLQPYGDRAIVVKGGVWPRQTPLALVHGRDEGDASVREALPTDNPSSLVEGWDIPALMARGGFTQVDLLKIDIEGTEVELFLKNPDCWLSCVRNLTVELHGPGSSAALERALASYTFRRQICGELTFCFDLRPKQPSPDDPARASANAALK